jgi:hypothetical protein
LAAATAAAVLEGCPAEAAGADEAAAVAGAAEAAVDDGAALAALAAGPAGDAGVVGAGTGDTAGACATWVAAAAGAGVEAAALAADAVAAGDGTAAGVGVVVGADAGFAAAVVAAEGAGDDAGAADACGGRHARRRGDARSGLAARSGAGGTRRAARELVQIRQVLVQLGDARLLFLGLAIACDLVGIGTLALDRALRQREPVRGVGGGFLVLHLRLHAAGALAVRARGRRGGHTFGEAPAEFVEIAALRDQGLARLVGRDRACLFARKESPAPHRPSGG